LKFFFEKGQSEKLLRLLFCTGLALGLGGCAIGFYAYPAMAQRVDDQTAYPALKPAEVYFFLSKEAFPQGLRSIPVATLLTPWQAEWSYGDLVREFQKKAAEVGANAIIFDGVGTSKKDMGLLIYHGHAIAYRLFKQSPSEDMDLSSTQYGTQNPDLSLVK